MKVSQILEECLGEDERFKGFNRMEKLSAKMVIKHALGANDQEIPAEDIPAIKQQFKTLITQSGLL